MEDNQESGMNAFKGSATGVNLRYMSTKTDDFCEWPSLSIESSFSYVANSANKSSSSSPQQERLKISTTISKHGITNSIVSSQQKTLSTTERKGNNCLDKKSHEFNTDLSLQGKRLQLWPEFWSLDYAKQTRSNSDVECKNSESDEEFRLNSGLQTYPPSTRSLSTNEVDSGSDNFLHRNRHRFPAFHPRPLGQPWVGYSPQRKKTPELGRSLDNLYASGVRQPLFARKRGHPPQYALSPHLRRSSSQDSFKGHHIPRTRSASLPVPSKLHESRMVMEWKEKRAGGVTYVTPCLQTLSDGDLSNYSQLKIAHETTGTTQKDLHENNS